ncbi:SUMF1/EgtB/PvdO family nonheme iron enzyme [Geobacter pelophilus]|uniref:SUMF1/EgtB/PvdO family nonheme iron enzyme n=1 Tax=Geoanaerobacter pelophilus TaxID=60036 RepID=A0AAW4L459_9BACT|nr:SUMF1/EgtB/PvdO family nonheme iron enzyme [Geoanaerobacter pelophilus]MBT0664347.1 SUMF1/EgtB/PvdO family nonheme iron enzyme [Geoanaerobacter pelophilus]
MALPRGPLSETVEAASGGKQTVLYTAKGQPSYFNKIQAFNCEDVGTGFGTGKHPAFIVNGVEKSEIYIGTYQATIQNGEAVSLPNQDPAHDITYPDARAACSAAGAGFHLMTNWEWASIGLWRLMNNLDPLMGNNAQGEARFTTHDGIHITATLGPLCAERGRVLTGGGLRHDNTAYGIADLVGNVWEWVDGLYILGGAIHMPSDNNYSLAATALPDTGAKFDLIEAPPGSSRLFGIFQISDTQTCIRSGVVTGRGWIQESFGLIEVKDGYTPPIALKQALLQPVGSQAEYGDFIIDNYGGYPGSPVRGGSNISGNAAGLAALYTLLACDSGNLIGFRPAFIE